MRDEHVGAIAVVALSLLALLALSPTGQAANDRIEVLSEDEHVIEGDDVVLNVTFLPSQSTEEITVQCELSACNEWVREVTYDPDKENCAFEAPRYCHFTFPNGFEPESGSGRSASELGEPAFAAEYEASLSGLSGEEFEDTFRAHLSTAGSCRDNEVRRGEAILISTSGHPDGAEFTVRVKDGSQTLFENKDVSRGQQIPYRQFWYVPLDFPIQDGSREVELQVSSPDGISEREDITVTPGVATPDPIAFPSDPNKPFFERGLLDQDLDFNRTEPVKLWLRYRFFAGPEDCENLNREKPEFTTTLTSTHVQGERVSADVRRIQNVSDADGSKEVVDSTETNFAPGARLFTFNYTIPVDEQITEQSSDSPLYDLRVPQQEIGDGNRIGVFNTSDYRVEPYTIEPEFEVLQEEVERLETAELVMNLTYADDSPFTPDDTNEDLNVEFAQTGENPERTLTANHRGEGIWNVSVPLGFEYEPLGEYEWRIDGIPDNHGDEPNRIPDTIPAPFNIVSARPLLNLTTIVGEDTVSSAQRSQVVHANLHAEFRDGTPLTDENVDSELGGIQLDVKKTNDAGRVVDQDSYTMESIDDDGNWVRSVRIGKTPSVAPAGTWDFQITAQDDKTPANVNVSSFPFEVRPANVTVSDVRSPPALLDSERLVYEFRLVYPDGTRLTPDQVDPERRGELNVRLERPSLFSDGADVEVADMEPRPVDGQKWRVQLQSSRIVPGNHFINVTGQDIHGNPIPAQSTRLFSVLFEGEFRNSTTKLCPESTRGPDEPCEIERGETVTGIFPGSEGDTGMTGPNVSVRVHRQVPGEDRWILVTARARVASDTFFEQTGRDVGNDHVGRFQTTESTPLGTYRLAILGRDSDEHGFAGFTEEFNVTRITVNRDIVKPIPDAVEKQKEITATIEHKEGDIVQSAVVDAGPVRSRAVEATETGVGTFLRWTPTRSMPTGPATMTVNGQDIFGNPFEVTLGPFELLPLDINVTPTSQPPDTARRGQPFQFPARITYETGNSFTDRGGSPEVRVINSEGVTVDTGSARFAGRQPWEVQWIPNATLPRGEYVLEVGGEDSRGNVFEPFRSDPIDLEAGTVRGTVTQQPTTVRRGETATATFSFPAEPENLTASLTTGSTELGDPAVRIRGNTVEVAFQTDRQTGTPGVDARFTLEGSDIVGNELDGRTDSFDILPLQMRVRVLDQPPRDVRVGETVQAAFSIEYPNDGGFLRQETGSPIVGVFAEGRPAGPIEPTPLENRPEVWRIEWTPPDDADTGIPYSFSISALDRWENEAPATSTNGFFISNPVIPDYMPVPGPGPAAVLAAMLGAGLAAMWRRPRS